MHCLQPWYGLADEALEDTLYARVDHRLSLIERLVKTVSTTWIEAVVQGRAADEAELLKLKPAADRCDRDLPLPRVS